MTDGQFLFCAALGFGLILWGVHKIVRAVHDFDEEAEGSWKDIEWWW